MGKDKISIGEVSKNISKDFTVGDSESLIPAVNFKTLKEFQAYLSEKLLYLLDNKYDKLVNALYRIDLNEEKLSELFSGKNREYIPNALAKLIIERTIQKIEFRQKYKEGRL